jgi:hypothetical protein
MEDLQEMTKEELIEKIGEMEKRCAKAEEERDAYRRMHDRESEATQAIRYAAKHA